MVRDGLAIIFANRREDIECLYRVVASDGFMGHAAGNSPHLTGSDNVFFVADRKSQFAFQQQSHLLVGMVVHLDDGVRRKLDERQHHAFPGGGKDIDTWEDVVFRAIFSTDDVF